MLPDPAGIEPAISSSPVGHASDWATEAADIFRSEQFNMITTSALELSIFFILNIRIEGPEQTV